ncbi:MAG: NAD(P)H-dependent glycerol-3-phosphate dehydrogenase [Rickettsiaceae bacterium]|nr:NAD(P)H-dependent glycerol-3-phosphate dehydrogenase [Rickettsiaceae bacterium]
MNKILIVGAGSWGTALGVAFAKNNKVHFFTNDEQKISIINSAHKFPNFPFAEKSDNISASNKLIDGCEYIILAIPSDILVDFTKNNYEFLKAKKNIIIASKGLNHKEPEFLSSFFEKININPFFLYGPNFADEIAKGLNAACNIAAKDFDAAQKVAKILTTKDLNILAARDYITIQICGCYKNILSIYCGYIHEKGLGINFRAKTCVDAIVEIMNICEEFGASGREVISYAGIGDIMISCFSNKSRNFQFGANIARGEQNHPENLAEGVNSAKSLYVMTKNFANKPVILEKIYNLIIEYEASIR